MLTDHIVYHHHLQSLTLLLLTPCLMYPSFYDLSCLWSEETIQFHPLLLKISYFVPCHYQISFQLSIYQNPFIVILALFSQVIYQTFLVIGIKMHPIRLSLLTDYALVKHNVIAGCGKRFHFAIHQFHVKCCLHQEEAGELCMMGQFILL